MNQAVIDAITNGNYTSKTQEAKFGKKRIKEIQKLFDNLIQENLMPKETSTSNVHYSLVTIKPPDQEQKNKNSDNHDISACTSNAHRVQRRNSVCRGSFSDLPSYKEILLGIVENYKTEILFLREQVKQKDILLSSQQKVINDLASSSNYSAPKNINSKDISQVIHKQFRDDVSVTSCSSDDTDLEEMKMLYMQQEVQRRNSSQKKKRKKKKNSGNKTKVKKRTLVNMIKDEPKNTFLRMMKRTGL